MTLSKADIKLFNALKTAHGRKKHQQFIVEGAKMVAEALNADMPMTWVAALPDWLQKHAQQCAHIKCYELDERSLKQLSLMQQPNQVLAVLHKPEPAHFSKADKEWVLALDGIQDPGNMGTIIRTAEWFGIQKILCSRDSVDVFNPKVVQASMGSVFRVAVYYEELIAVLAEARSKGEPVLAALLQGNNLFNTKLPKSGYLIIGNEGKGISQAVCDLNPESVYIPSANISKAESLNAAIAASIFLSRIADI